MKIVRICTTKYLGPTDTRGARVKATHATTRKSATVGWDYAFDVVDNHIRAAIAVLGREPEFRAALDDGGYVFGVDPANDLEHATQLGHAPATVGA